MLARRTLLTGLAAVAVPARGQERPRVVASFSILADFVRAVGGDAVEAATLVGPDRDAHVFEPTPTDARTLAAARLVVVNGLGFEGWMARLVRASGFRGPTVTASDGVTTIRVAGRGHGGSGVDPHVWQDPLRAKLMVGNVARGLAAADPARAGLWRANAAGYAAELDALDAWIAAEIARVPAERRLVIASHDAFGYFAERYGVAFRAPRGVSTGSEPSAAEIGRLIREVKRDGARAIFMENIADPRTTERIARETGARLGGRLYSDALSGPDGPAPTYLAMMRLNATRLVEAMLAG